jgi:hypothetical protein
MLQSRSMVILLPTTLLLALVQQSASASGSEALQDVVHTCTSPKLSYSLTAEHIHGSQVKVEVPSDAHVIWSTHPMSKQDVSITVCADPSADPGCGATAALSPPRGAVVVEASCATTIRMWVPPELSLRVVRTQPARAVTRTGQVIADECTDGVDNDGDRLADTLDPGCLIGKALRESGERRGAGAHSFSWTLANESAHGDAYLQTLRWTDAAGGTHTVIDQTNSDVIYFPHANTGNTTYLSGWSYSTFTKASDDPQSHAVPGKQTTPLEQTGDEIRTEVTSAGDDFVEFLMQTEHARIQQHLRFSGDVGTMSLTVTLLADAPRALYFPVNLGNLQIGPLSAGDENHTGVWHLTQKWNGAIQRGFCEWIDSKTGNRTFCPQHGTGWRGEPLWPLGAPDAVPIRGNEYPSLGAISPVTAVGDSSSISVGLMAIGQEFSADQTTVAVDQADLPRAPIGPILQSWVKIQLSPGQSRNLTFAFSVASSAKTWEVTDIKPVVGQLMKPYQTFFHTAYGSTPTYCPRPSIAWEMATDRQQYVRSCSLCARDASRARFVQSADWTIHLCCGGRRPNTPFLWLQVQPVCTMVQARISNV